MSDKIKIDVEAGTAAFVQDMDKAGRAVEGLGHRAEGARGFFDRFKEGFEIGAGIEAFKGGLELIEKPFEVIADAGKEAIRTVVEWTKEAMESAEQTVNLSQSLGFTVETLQSLTAQGKHFGVSQEEVQAGLQHFSKTLGEFNATGGESGKKLEALGINMRRLANESPEAALHDVADQLAHITDHSAQAAAAQELFSRSGGRLLPIFREGGDAIDAFTRKGIAAGHVLTAFDESRLVASKRAIDEAGESFDALKNAVALGAAPVVKALGDKIKELSPDGEALRHAFQTAFDTIIVMGAHAIDTLAHFGAKVLETGSTLALLQSQFSGVVGDQEGAAAFHTLGETLHKFANATEGLDLSGNADRFVKSLHEGIDREASHIKKTLDEATTAAPAGPSHALQDLERQKKVAEELEHLRDQIAESSGDKFSASAAKLTAEGATPKQIAEYGRLVDELKDAERLKKEMGEFDALWKKAETPLDRYNESLKQMNDLLAHGRINQEQFNRAAAEAKRDLNREEHKAEEKKAELVSRRFSFDLGGRGGAGDKADLPRQALELQKKQDQRESDRQTWLQQIWQAITQGGPSGNANADTIASIA